MLVYGDSDIYRYQNNGDAFFKRISTAMKQVGPSTVMNEHLKFDIELMIKNYKEAIVLKIVEALRTQRIMIVYISDPTKRLPDMLPFVRVKREGEECIIVDMSRYITPNGEYTADDADNSSSNTPKYRIQVPKLHDILVPVYLALEVFGAHSTLPFETSRDMAILWAEMVNQVLGRIGIFGSNNDRRDAYRYFGIKFYLKYYLQCAPAVVESISNGVLKNGKSILISNMEEKMRSMGVDPYQDFAAYCSALFSAEVNGIRGLDQSVVKMLNFPYFIKKFSETFGPEALGAFYAPEYLLYVLYVSYRKADIVRDRAFDYVTGAAKTSVMPKLMQSLYKEI